MKPEYTLTIKGRMEAERVVSGLLASGYILSKTPSGADEFEIAIYDKKEMMKSGEIVTSPHSIPYDIPFTQGDKFWTNKDWTITCGDVNSISSSITIPSSGKQTKA